MKFLGALLFLLSLNSFSQTQKITVKKEIKKPSLIQSEAPWHVTFCNYYNGTIKLADLYNPKNKIVINHNSIELAIISYELVYKSHGKLCMVALSSADSIPLEWRNKVLQVDRKSKMFISDIKAVSKYQDTILLNSIELRVID